MKRVVFIVGESGSGKSSMINYLTKTYPDQFYYIKSTVTRAPRMGEVDGVSYHFVRRDEFMNREMVQYVEFGGNLYGTELKEFQKDQAIGLIAVTPEGILDISNGLEKLGIEMDYKIVFFDSTDEILRSRGVDESRITRGNIRMHFKSENMKGSFNKFKSPFNVQDHENLTQEEQESRNESLKSIIER